MLTEKRKRKKTDRQFRVQRLTNVPSAPKDKIFVMLDDRGKLGHVCREGYGAKRSSHAAFPIEPWCSDRKSNDTGDQGRLHYRGLPSFFLLRLSKNLKACILIPLSELRAAKEIVACY